MTQDKCDRHMKLLLEALVQLRLIGELPELYDQTANRLVSALGASGCFILDRPLSTFSTVVAEYDREKTSKSMLGQKLPGASDPKILKALSSLQPVPLKKLPGIDSVEAQSFLIMATSHGEKANGLIYLYQCDRDREWSEADLEFLQRLGEQVGSCIDHLSVQKELQESQKKVSQATRTIENFLHNISDKLRNPLNAIIGSLNLILDDVFDDDPEEQRDYIKEAHKSSITLLHLINDLLHFSNLKGNQHQIARELGQPVKLSKMLKEVEHLTKPRAEHQNIYLEIITPAEYDEVILSANESRLVQIFLNLVGNAIKFTHSGGVTIRCQVITQKVVLNDQECPGWLEIQVCDTGIGVPTEYVRRVFDPFFQVHDPRTSSYPGTGLGLSISKKLIEMMGGEITFYSMGEGLGSTVIFTIPLYQTPVKIYPSSSKVLNMPCSPRLNMPGESKANRKSKINPAS